MAASGDSTPSAESGDRRPVPRKRKKIQIQGAAPELVGGSYTDRGQEKQQRKTTDAAGGEGSIALPTAPAINTPPPPLRCPPFPKSGDWKAMHERSIECRRISKLAAEDPRRNLPTVVKPKDPYTADSVASSRDKALVRDAARSIVNVSSIAPDGKVICRCTGFVISWNGTKKCARILTSSLIVRGFDHIPKDK